MVKMTEQLADRQHPERNLRPLEELDMMDSFLFEAATEDAEKAEKIARIIIERVTGHRVKNLIIESQKSLKGINKNGFSFKKRLFSSKNIKCKGAHHISPAFICSAFFTTSSIVPTL